MPYLSKGFRHPLMVASIAISDQTHPLKVPTQTLNLGVIQSATTHLRLVAPKHREHWNQIGRLDWVAGWLPGSRAITLSHWPGTQS